MNCRDIMAGLVAVVVTVWHSGAHAGGEVQVRGVYYKEKATRVIQPVADVTLDVGSDTEISGHVLLDAITSASVSSGAANDAFTENRFEGGLAVARWIASYQVGLWVRYSNEPDYKSIYGGLRWRVDLARKNTTLGLAAAFGSDDIDNSGAQGNDLGQVTPIAGEVSTALASLSLTQLLSPRVVAGITYDLIYHRGFLENPYRSVEVGGELMPESVPDSRLRHAVFGSVRGFIPATRTTIIAGYRFYSDDWGLRGHTPDMKLIQEIATDLEVHLRYRYHRQNGASFFRPFYDRMEPSITSDTKLGPFTSQTYGIKIDTALSNLGATGSMAAFRADLVIDYVVQNNHFGNAVVLQLGLAFPFGS